MREFKSLFKDTNYHNNPKGTWQHAKNLLFTKQFNSPVNENGSKYNHKFEGTIVGRVETNREIVYFIKRNPRSGAYTIYNSEIHVFNLDKEIFTQTIKGNFNFNRPVEGVFFYNFKEELIVAFCDGVYDDSNSPKIINLSNNEFNLTRDNRLEDRYLPLTELFPSVTTGIIESKRVDGNIEGDAVYITFKYCYKNSQETIYKDINNFIYLKQSKPFFHYENEVNSGLSITLKNLKNEVYDSVKIGLYIINKEGGQAYESNNYSISNSKEIIIISDLANFKKIANEELVIPKERFSKIESLTGHKNSLLIGKPVKDKMFKFQKYANLLSLGFKRKTDSNRNMQNTASDDFEDNKEKSNDYHLQSDEVYNFFIQLELKSGYTTEWFKISNNNYNGAAFLSLTQINESADFAEKYDTRGNNITGFYDTRGGESTYRPSTLEKEDYKKFHIENDSFYNTTEDYYIAGTWRNENIKYPNDDEYNSKIDYDGNPIQNGIDLRNSPLRLHRMPHKVDINHCFIKNLKSVVPAHILNQIENYRIGFTKRDMNNSLVITNPLMTNAYYYDDEHKEYDDNSETAGMDAENLTPFQHKDYGQPLPRVSMRKNLLLNPDLEIIKPKLNFNFIIANHVALGLRINNTTESGYSLVDKTSDPKFLKHKYHYQDNIFYNYKLPNNSAQGSEYLDGGLFSTLGFNYMGAYNSQNYANNLFTHSLNGDYTRIRMVFANVLLCNLKKDLYELNSNNIVSSFNTVNYDSNSNENQYVYIGDVSNTIVNGRLKYRNEADYRAFPLKNLISVNNDEDTFVYPLMRINTFFKNTKLLIKKNPIYSHYAITDTENLNSLTYGYETDETSASNKINDLASYEAFNVYSNYLNRFPFRIYRSVIFGNESYILNSLKKFLFNNYYELPNSKGDLIAINSNDSNLYIQMRYELLLAKVKEVITSREGENYLTEGDIFDRSPAPMTLDNKGYIGSEHKFACKIFKEGYLSIDHKKGNIILTTDRPTLISDESIRNWCMEYLPFEEEYREDLNGTSVAIDNPYNNIGFAIGYDNQYRRIFITKLYPSDEDYKLEELPKDYYKDLLNSTSSPNSSYKNPKDNKKSFTLSYSLDTKSWLCYHDFIPNFYSTINNVIYAGKSVKMNSNTYNYGVVHTLFNGFKGLYFGIKYKSYIDIIFNAQPSTSKNYEAIEFITRSIRNNGVVQNSTIGGIAVFNDNQSSGVVNFKEDNVMLVRKKEGSWRFNKFRDLVKKDMNDFPIITERGDINTDILDFNKNWFDKSYFISKFIVVRLIWNNDTNDSIYLNEVTMESSKSYI